MKRDMDLNRLLQTEGEGTAPDVSAYAEAQKNYHRVLIIEAINAWATNTQ
jgi:hypothetical protein